MGNWFNRGLLFFHLIFQADAAVVVDTVPLGAEWETGLKQELNKFIASGEADKWDLRFRVEGNLGALSQHLERDANGVQVLVLTKESFNLLDEKAKETAVAYLAEYHERETNSVYQVNVPTKVVNDLTKEAALVRLGIPFADLADVVKAEALLSPYGKRWAWKWSEYNGPNCYHTSVASIFDEWEKHRYMGPRELMCHQETYFDEIAKPEAWGDLISFNDGNDVPIHAFTYLGTDRKTPGRALVFTKNGYQRSRFLMMSYSAVYNIYQGFGIRHIRYYRPKAGVKAVDPAKVAQAPCYTEYYYKWEKPSLREANPLLQAGLKAKPTTSFAPIVVR